MAPQKYLSSQLEIKLYTFWVNYPKLGEEIIKGALPSVDLLRPKGWADPNYYM